MHIRKRNGNTEIKSVFVVFMVLSSCLPFDLMADAWSPPADYYDSATGSGAVLKSQLTAIMSSGHIQANYGEFRSSAAFHDQDPGNSSRILLCYNRSPVLSQWDSGRTWNREHVWPQSRQPGDAGNSTTGNLGDPFALKPCNPSLNSTRGNKPYGGADLTGACRHVGSYYFPGDVEKGDIARSLFYSATRWSSKGITLVNGIPSGNQMGDLASLLRWHYMDPPDTFERRRNHVIYSSAYNPSYYTNNRNAYIDRPEFVWSVFGGDDNDTQLYVGSDVNSDGASSVTVDLGAVGLRSGSTFAETTVVLHKIGNDGTYYRIITSDNVTCRGATPGHAFDYNTQDITLTLSVKEVPAQPGRYVETVVIDNLDVCGNSPAGRGANDGDDVITITYTVLAADLSGDDRVNLDDLLDLAAGWLTVSPDLNIVDSVDETPGIINFRDLAVLAGEWKADER